MKEENKRPTDDRRPKRINTFSGKGYASGATVRELIYRLDLWKMLEYSLLHRKLERWGDVSTQLQSNELDKGMGSPCRGRCPVWTSWVYESCCAFSYFDL